MLGFLIVEAAASRQRVWEFPLFVAVLVLRLVAAVQPEQRELDLDWPTAYNTKNLLRRGQALTL